jgi:hypothetical protein
VTMVILGEEEDSGVSVLNQASMVRGNARQHVPR